MVIVYRDDDTDNSSSKNKNQSSWALDLPGGKRHLGEQSFEGAIRETEEESSLKIDERWLSERSPRYDGVKSNAYFFLRPPAEMVMEQVEKDPFWDVKWTGSSLYSATNLLYVM